MFASLLLASCLTQAPSGALSSCGLTGGVSTSREVFGLPEEEERGYPVVYVGETLLLEVGFFAPDAQHWPATVRETIARAVLEFRGPAREAVAVGAITEERRMKAEGLSLRIRQPYQVGVAPGRYWFMLRAADCAEWTQAGGPVVVRRPSTPREVAVMHLHSASELRGVSPDQARLHLKEVLKSPLPRPLVWGAVNLIVGAKLVDGSHQMPIPEYCDLARAVDKETGELGKTVEACVTFERTKRWPFEQWLRPKPPAPPAPKLPPTYDSLVREGWDAYRANSLAAAKQKFQQALSFDPAGSHANLGMAHTTLVDSTAASVPFFERGLADGHGDPADHFAFATALRESGATARADATLRKLVEIDNPRLNPSGFGSKAFESLRSRGLMKRVDPVPLPFEKAPH